MPAEFPLLACLSFAGCLKTSVSSCLCMYYKVKRKAHLLSGLMKPHYQPWSSCAGGDTGTSSSLPSSLAGCCRARDTLLASATPERHCCESLVSTEALSCRSSPTPLALVPCHPALLCVAKGSGRAACLTEHKPPNRRWCLCCVPGWQP